MRLLLSGRDVIVIALWLGHDGGVTKSRASPTTTYSIIIMDNLNTHLEGKNGRGTAFNACHRGKFEFHYTPIHASWVNQVEVFFSILQRAVLRWGSFRSVEEMEDAIRRFICRWNEVDGHPFDWTFRGSKAA